MFPLVTAIPNGLIVEWGGPFVVDWKYGLGARIAEIVKDPIIPKNGIMECKAKPGLGIEISDEAIKKYSVKPAKKTVRRMNPRYQ